MELFEKHQAKIICDIIFQLARSPCEGGLRDARVRIIKATSASFWHGCLSLVASQPPGENDIELDFAKSLLQDAETRVRTERNQKPFPKDISLTELQGKAISEELERFREQARSATRRRRSLQWTAKPRPTEIGLQRKPQ